MNNFDFGNFSLIRPALVAVLLAGIFSDVKADTQYGPLRAGESLSRIVNQNYLASPYENDLIMREILRLNPQAFINNNMGLIKQGVMLTLPSDASIRRSQQQSGASTAAAATAVSQAETRPRARVQTLQATLAQVRNERDQANLRSRRIEAESAAKLESFNVRVERLESEKERLSQQLTSSDAELKALKQTLLEVRQENSRLTSTMQQPAANSDELSQQLSESKQAVALKQQALEKLQVSVSELTVESEKLKASHKASIDRLEEANKALEEKLAAQSELNSSDDVAKQLEAKVAELTIQHKQQLDDLQASFDSKTNNSSTVQADTKNLTNELERVKSESLEIKNELAAFRSETEELRQQHKSEIEILKSKHKQAIDELDVSFKTQLAEKTKSETNLNKLLSDSKVTSESAASELAIVNNENNQLKAELSEARASLEALASSSTTDQNQEILRESVSADPVAKDNSKALISGPITKQVIVERLENPVAFPLWGLLLGAFALGFTSLMMLFTRRKTQGVAISENMVTSTSPHSSMPQTQEELVFRAGDPSARDPDVESLRVPPRRDPSRVAILDPTMVGASTAVVVGAAAALEETSGQAQIPPNHVVISEQDEFEVKLKMLMAQTYEELGDTSAANQLIAEIDEANRTL